MSHNLPLRHPFALLAVAVLVPLVFACESCASRSGATAAGLPAFDSASAWRHLEAQLAFGPRPVGVPAHETLKDYLNTELRKTTPDVQLQQWTDPTLRL